MKMARFKLSAKQKKYLEQALQDMTKDIITSDELYEYLNFLLDDVIPQQKVMSACKQYGCFTVEIKGKQFIGNPKYKGTVEEFNLECLAMA